MSESAHWRREATLSVLLLAVVTGTAWWTRIWVLTALPVGFLFGFLLQKGDLCGASAFSEVVLARDWRKTFGLWVAIVVSMIGFAAIAGLGWVRLAPKPMFWLNYVVGGALFGVGTVLAGGCISGCLFKAGAGNLNSMAALTGIPLGIGMVEYGPLNSIHRSMMTHVVTSGAGGPVTLSSLTGVPYWMLAMGFAGATVAVVLARRAKRPPHARDPQGLCARRLLTGSWKPWQAGLAIGLLAVPAYLSSAASGRNYPLGVSHGVLQAYELLTDNQIVWQPALGAAASSAAVARYSSAARPARPTSASSAAQPVPTAPQKPINLWVVGVVVGLVLGAFVAARLSGVARLAPRDPADTVTAFLGGILVGAGAAFATGCVVGNILSGWALMSVGLFVFGLVTILANWITTYVHLMGGTLDRAALRAVLLRRP
jgi:uncharacterized membrane protein YedE/YeeE